MEIDYSESSSNTSLPKFPIRKKIRLPRIVYFQGRAFFITIGTHNKSPWFRLYPLLCDSATQYLCALASNCNVKVYAWCIMPDHIHLLVQGKMIIEFIRRFKGKMTPEFRKIEPQQKLWQRSFYDHAIRKEESLSDVASYIWENPVRAKTIEKPNEYLYSGSIVWPNWREFYGRG